jgi:hypothetical protein
LRLRFRPIRPTKLLRYHVVDARQTLLRSNSARISAARSGVSPHVMKMTSAASRFFAVKWGFVPAAVARNEGNPHGAIWIQIRK